MAVEIPMLDQPRTGPTKTRSGGSPSERVFGVAIAQSLERFASNANDQSFSSLNCLNLGQSRFANWAISKPFQPC